MSLTYLRFGRGGFESCVLGKKLCHVHHHADFRRHEDDRRRPFPAVDNQTLVTSVQGGFPA